jgi:hypothetical protein
VPKAIATIGDASEQEPSIYLDAAYRAEINRRNQIRGLPLLPNAIPFEPNTVSPRPMRP